MEERFDFSRLVEKHELSQNVNEKGIQKFQIESPESLFIHKVFTLRAKPISFQCSNKKENEAKLQGIKKAATDEYKIKYHYNCLMREGEYKT